MDKMRAMTIEKFGDPSVFKSSLLDIPVPKEDELLVKVHAASFNPADAAARSGEFGKLIDVSRPRILGVDLAGEVVASGDKARKFRQGDRVYSYLSIKENGSYAEYTVLKEKDADLIPERLSYAEAASLPLSALTAYQGLYDLGELRENQRILINGATGGVGVMAVQLAKLKNAQIIGTGSTETLSVLEEMDILQSIDYRKENLTDVITEKLDLIYNLAPLKEDEMKKLFPLLKDGGRFVSTTGIPKDAGDKDRITLLSEQAKRGGERLHEISELVEEGKLKPRVSSTWKLEDVPEVHRLHEAGKLHGKAVFLISS
ncbi:NADP-dependent oxidoreductase [Proteiniclasticum sp. C24MP]|uniref:NADP-dependent oxidoreductase n=1 Tax=Proteiniclasticum sp. C24MP TaxID=3374101 RepID=UPI003754134B